MFCLIFKIHTELDDITEFIRIRLSDEHVKVEMEHSSYEMETGTVVLH